MDHSRFLSEHFELTRRYFLRAGVMGMTASQLTVNAAALTAADELAQASPRAHTKPDKGGGPARSVFHASGRFSRRIAW